VADHRPTQCRGCGAKLSGSGPSPLRHQVWELPEIQPLVSEHRLHRLTCAGCGVATCGELPAGLPRGQAGPRLIGFVALLMGSFRQSKRKTALFLTQILHTPCSPGWVVKLQNQATAALRSGYDDLVAQLPAEGNLNIDESPNKQAQRKTWLWVFVARRFTVFALRLFVATLAGTIVISTATYRLIELPGQRLGRLLIQWLDSRDETLAQACQSTPSITTVQPEKPAH
jgi:transposase